MATVGVFVITVVFAQIAKQDSCNAVADEVNRLR